MSWIIYKHTNIENGKVYVGQTKQSLNDRWQNGKGYNNNKYFKNAISKYSWDGFRHEILEDNILTQDKANEREIYWISFYNSYVGFDNCNGYNLTKGGDNRDHLGIEIAQIDTISLDIINVFLTIRSAESKTGIDHSMIGRCCDKNKKGITAGGYYWCFLSDYNKGNWSPKKKKDYHDKKELSVYQLDDSFSIVNKFHSQNEAARFTNIPSSNICNACNKTRGYSKAGGYYWCYVKDYEKFEPLLPKDERPVVRIATSNTKDIKFYNMISIASRENNIDSGLIYKACKGENITAGGYFWSYLIDYTDSWKPRENMNNREVICIETKEIFKSIADASKKIGGISISQKVLNDLHYTRGGYHWMYLDDYNKTTSINIPMKRTGNAKKVICIETKEIFDSVISGAKKNNADPSEIVKCCKNYSKTAKGYHWAYLDDYNDGLFKIIDKKVGKHGMKKVLCIETDEVFESLSDASRAMSIDSSSIGRVCKGKQSVAGGYHWKYVND